MGRPWACISGILTAPCGVSALSSSKPRHGGAKGLCQAPNESMLERAPEPGLCGPGPVTLHTTLLPRWACLLPVSPSSLPHTFFMSRSSRPTPAQPGEAPRVPASAPHQGGCHPLSRHFRTFPRARAEPGQARGRVRSGLGLAIPRHVAGQLHKVMTGSDRAGAVSSLW